MLELIKAILIAFTVAATPVESQFTQAQDNTIRVTADYGGVIDSYIKGMSDIRQSGTKVIIDGPCFSACTLVLGLLPADQVCTTEYGLFGFHSGWYQEVEDGPRLFAKEATRMIWNMYPEDVRYELLLRGWDGNGNNPHPELVYIPGPMIMNVCSD